MVSFAEACLFSALEGDAKFWVTLYRRASVGLTYRSICKRPRTWKQNISYLVLNMQVGLSYFREFWNIVEFANVVLSLLGVAVYFYLDVLRSELMSKLPHKVPNVFINFQYASIW